jgi:hypothetical protein
LIVVFPAIASVSAIIADSISLLRALRMPAKALQKLKNTNSNVKTKGTSSRVQKFGFAPYLRPTRGLGK